MTNDNGYDDSLDDDGIRQMAMAKTMIIMKMAL
jgi:hypothetical protein